MINKSIVSVFLFSVIYLPTLASDKTATPRSASRLTPEEIAFRQEIGYDSSSSYDLPPATQPSPPLRVTIPASPEDFRTAATKRKPADIDNDNPETPASPAAKAPRSSLLTSTTRHRTAATAASLAHIMPDEDCVLCVVGVHATHTAIDKLQRVTSEQTKLTEKLRCQTDKHNAEVRAIVERLKVLEQRLSIKHSPRPATR